MCSVLLSAIDRENVPWREDFTRIEILSSLSSVPPACPLRLGLFLDSTSLMQLPYLRADFLSISPIAHRISSFSFSYARCDKRSSRKHGRSCEILRSDSIDIPTASVRNRHDLVFPWIDPAKAVAIDLRISADAAPSATKTDARSASAAVSPRQAQRTKTGFDPGPSRARSRRSLRREREDRSRNHQMIGDSTFFQAISLRRGGKPSHSTIFMVRHCAMRRRHRPRCRFAERLQSSRLPSHPQLAATVRAPPRYA